MFGANMACVCVCVVIVVNPYDCYSCRQTSQCVCNESSQLISWASPRPLLGQLTSWPWSCRVPGAHGTSCPQQGGPIPTSRKTLALGLLPRSINCLGLSSVCASLWQHLQKLEAAVPGAKGVGASGRMAPPSAPHRWIGLGPNVSLGNWEPDEEEEAQPASEKAGKGEQR